MANVKESGSRGTDEARMWQAVIEYTLSTGRSWDVDQAYSRHTQKQSRRVL